MNGRRDPGFTLLELLVALAIVGMLLRITIPVLASAYDAWRLRKLSHEVVFMLREARGAALEGDASAFIMDITQRLFSAEGRSRPMRLPSSVSVKVSAAGELSDETRASIAFEPDGTSSGGEVTLRSGNLEQTIRVDWLSSQIEIQEPIRIHAP